LAYQTPVGLVTPTINSRYLSRANWLQKVLPFSTHQGCFVVVRVESCQLMICSCGGETKERKVIRQFVIVGAYERCTACRRIAWAYMPPVEIMAKIQPKGTHIKTIYQGCFIGIVPNLICLSCMTSAPMGQI